MFSRGGVDPQPIGNKPLTVFVLQLRTPQAHRHGGPQPLHRLLERMGGFVDQGRICGVGKAGTVGFPAGLVQPLS